MEIDECQEGRKVNDLARERIIKLQEQMDKAKHLAKSKLIEAAGNLSQIIYSRKRRGKRNLNDTVDQFMRVASFVTTYGAPFTSDMPYVSLNVFRILHEPLIGNRVGIAAKTETVWEFLNDKMVLTEKRPLMSYYINATVLHSSQCSVDYEHTCAYCLKIECPENLKMFINLLGSIMVHRGKPIAFVSHVMGSCFDASGVKVLAAKLVNTLKLIEKM